ncbi:altronate dehydratase [Lampropedia puyangensis]|uniref:Altronate dehydratase n=1 Tax=Lampropedia puyangensis TaxID=1330072 RepID=A0A4S8FAL0_9BURK|nr:altronate dehydratase family protein [Lampropedia puyangensis]THU04051.1 altronate dehydratase [Lampropedia puyangensis]
MTTTSIIQPPSSIRAIRLAQTDNVAVAREPLSAGRTLVINGISVTLSSDIPAGHKFALLPIAGQETILKYGQSIGVATQAIAPGEHVHVHNLGMVASHQQHQVGQAYVPTHKDSEQRTFDGYVRTNGRVGTRNYIGVISSVNCSATVCRHIADGFNSQIAQYENVDGVVAITHGSGCGMGGNGEGLELLQRTLRGYAEHPNFAGIVIIGLGCEVNQIAPLVETLAARESGMFATLTIQDEGGTRETIAAGKALVTTMLEKANTQRRQPVALDHLMVGLQCGGSDGYSGISANPVLGAAVDLLVRQGGTAILSETPEIYGAEHLLTHRAVSQDVANKLMKRLQWWENYAAMHGGDLDNNPSPGNKAGGITTILEKSLGAVAKAGSSGLMAVYEYAEPVQAHGLVFMDTPGYDPVSATGQVAGGATLICFTTGRGSTYGCKPTPSLKLATNTPMFKRMELDMDFNCGTIVDGTQTIDEAAQVLLQLMIDTASGKASKSEENGLGDNEFLPWQLGAVM